MIADEEASLINVVVLVEDGEATEEEGRQIDELHKCCWYSVGLSVGWLAGWSSSGGLPIADEEASLINVVVLVEDGEATEEEGRQIDESHKCCWYSVGLSVGWLAGWLAGAAVVDYPPSIAEGQDHNFLRHRRTHVKLPTPTTSPSAAFATIVVAIRSFLCRCCRRTQLPRPPRLSFKSSSVTVALSFLKFHRHAF
ncbi:hypothetical protein BHE74_00003008 [Ensete ventricosum]|nr:hypothetical protein BHE74_00003008 [Ensete ventricosum]